MSEPTPDRGPGPLQRIDAASIAAHMGAIWAGSAAFGILQAGLMRLHGDQTGPVWLPPVVLFTIGAIVALVGYRSAGPRGRWVTHGFLGALALVAIASGGTCTWVRPLGDGYEGVGGFVVWLLGTLAVAVLTVGAGLIALVQRVTR